MLDRAKITTLVESRTFNVFIIVVIFINAVIMGFQTVELDADTSRFLEVMDWVCLSIYIIEAALKIYAWRGKYFRDGWNIFDFTIIVLCLVPVLFTFLHPTILRTIRLLRAFRVFRLVSGFRKMRVIMEAIIKALPSVGWTFLLTMVVFYIFAVIGVSSFGGMFPEHFGNLGRAIFTLFQLMTLENWTSVVNTVMEYDSMSGFYFFPFIIFASFIVINLIVGVIVGTMEESEKLERHRELELAQKQFDVEDKLNQLENAITDLKIAIEMEREERRE